MFGYWGERLVDQKPLSVYSSLTKEWVSQKNYDLPYEDLAQLQKNTVDNIVASFPLNFPLKSGDKIISIDGRSVVGLCAQDVFLDLILWVIELVVHKIGLEVVGIILLMVQILLN